MDDLPLSAQRFDDLLARAVDFHGHLCARVHVVAIPARARSVIPVIPALLRRARRSTRAR